MLNGIQPSPLISTDNSQPTLNQFGAIWLLHTDAYYCGISCVKQKCSPQLCLAYLAEYQQ